MSKPRIFIGSSGKQAKLLQAITRGLVDVAEVEPWTTTFNPGRSTLDRLVELSQEVDFAAFVFAQDDWTTTDASHSEQASPRDNVVFEAGLFGGALGIRRTFILHANGSKLPSDLLGLTSIRYDSTAGPAEVRAINQKLRKAIEAEGRPTPQTCRCWTTGVRRSAPSSSRRASGSGNGLPEARGRFRRIVVADAATRCPRSAFLLRGPEMAV
jgi:predicted nucleotide-binding protein